MSMVRLLLSHLVILWAWCLVTATCPSLKAAEVSESEAKAEFVFRIIQFIDWEPNSTSGDFVVGVIGDSDFAKVLERVLVDRKVKGKRISVRLAAKIEDLPTAEVVFVTGSNRRRLRAALGKPAVPARLLLGDSDAFLKEGGMISIVVSRSGKIRLGAGREALENSKLKVSSKLMRILAR